MSKSNLPVLLLKNLVLLPLEEARIELNNDVTKKIIDISKKIGTFDISTLPYEDCCTVFVPKHPVINPNGALCEEYEKLIPYKELIYKAIKEHTTIKVGIKEENKFSDLL